MAEEIRNAAVGTDAAGDRGTGQSIGTGAEVRTAAGNVSAAAAGSFRTETGGSAAPEIAGAAGRGLIHTEGLSKCYGLKRAVYDLNLDVRAGEIFGLLGPNGAGKTTTILMLLGLTEPTAGTAEIDGMDCTRSSLKVKRTVGYLPDNVGFYSDLTGRENLEFTGHLNGLSGEELQNRIDSLLERVGMTEAADRKTGTYSRGMRQRLGIADVLIKDPKIVIMDEPTLGIDPEGVRELMSIIRSLAEKDGKTVLISSHQLYQIQQICDRVGIFVGGELIACGPIRELARQMHRDGHYVLETACGRNEEKFREILRTLNGVRSVGCRNGIWTVESSVDVKPELLRRTLEEGAELTLLHQKDNDLDEIYRLYFEQAEEESNGKQNGKNSERH